MIPGPGCAGHAAARGAAQRYERVHALAGVVSPAGAVGGRSTRRRNGGKDPVCAVCGGPWTLRHGQLHHRSYARLGAEAWQDLIPICCVASTTAL